MVEKVDWFRRLIYLGIAGLLLIGFGGCYKAYCDTEKYVVATVSKTEKVTYSNGDSQKHKYLVYTDKGVFECTDSILFMKFDSSDVYGKIERGKRYELHIVGWRWHFGSWYPNILSIEYSK